MAALSTAATAPVRAITTMARRPGSRRVTTEMVTASGGAGGEERADQAGQQREGALHARGSASPSTRRNTTSRPRSGACTATSYTASNGSPLAHDEHGEDHAGDRRAGHQGGGIGIDQADGQGDERQREAVGLAVGALDPQGEHLAAEEGDRQPQAGDVEGSLEAGIGPDEERVGERRRRRRCLRRPAGDRLARPYARSSPDNWYPLPREKSPQHRAAPRAAGQDGCVAVFPASTQSPPLTAMWRWPTRANT